MGRPLPLLALRAFAQAAHLGSMKQAAEALGVTPGAVSQQIKALEVRLGTALFARGNREIRLNPAGARLHSLIAEPFRQIEAAMDGFGRAPRRQTLVVSTVASFAATWLVPRLGSFTARHPEIDVRIETTSRLVDLRRDPVDIALRHGLGNYPGLHAVKFLTPRLVPVCSPALLASGPPIREPADCLRHPLLQDSDRADWALWLRAHGVSDNRASRGPSFEDDFLLIRAAAAGQGIALVHDLYAADELESGRLVLVLDAPWPTPFAYYLVTRPEMVSQPKIASFRGWIIEEAATAPGAGR